MRSAVLVHDIHKAGQAKAMRSVVGSSAEGCWLPRNNTQMLVKPSWYSRFYASNTSRPSGMHGTNANWSPLCAIRK
jgi:hypothetical protein